MKYFFTSDEHYNHFNILEYSKRPFKTVDEMDETIIKNHNEVVGVDDIVYHMGDFTLKSKHEADNFIRRLNGNHIFIRGSHDYWMENDKTAREIIELKLEGEYIVMCHYAMRVWPRSHYNSWQLFGHSHGRLGGVGKSMDVGVDTESSEHKRFYPYSFEEIKKIMSKKEDNFNRIIK